jgi:hypothetical protein
LLLDLVAIAILPYAVIEVPQSEKPQEGRAAGSQRK